MSASENGERGTLAEAFIRGFQAGAERPQDAGDGDAMGDAFRSWQHADEPPEDCLCGPDDVCRFATVCESSPVLPAQDPSNRRTVQGRVVRSTGSPGVLTTTNAEPKMCTHSMVVDDCASCWYGAAQRATKTSDRLVGVLAQVVEAFKGERPPTAMSWMVLGQAENELAHYRGDG